MPVIISLYIPRKRSNNEDVIVVLIKREIYIIDNFRAKILIDNNIIEPKLIIIEVAKNFVLISSYKSIIISIKSR